MNFPDTPPQIERALCCVQRRSEFLLPMLGAYIEVLVVGDRTFRSGTQERDQRMNAASQRLFERGVIVAVVEFDGPMEARVALIQLLAHEETPDIQFVLETVGLLKIVLACGAMQAGSEPFDNAGGNAHETTFYFVGITCL